MRSILHIRIDSFFAAVEKKRRPELAGKPVVVGRPRSNTSGVVVSASREAAKLGVEEGMSVRQAQRTCPDAVVVTADYAAYRHVSEWFLDILARYSPLLEPDSLGSAYLDVTASRALFGDAQQIAARISSQVADLGYAASIGLASNKLIARAASDRPCSGGICNPTRNKTPRISNPLCVPPGSEAIFLASFPIAVLDVVTEKTKRRLNELGISTIGQLAMIPERLLIRQFGSVGRVMARQSVGIDASQVRAAYPPDVIRIEQTFETALEEPAQVEEYLRLMASEAVVRLRKRNSLSGEVTLTLTDDSQLLISNSQFIILKTPTDSAASIVQALVKLLESVMKPGMEVSRVMVTLSDLTSGAASQLCLIGDGERRRRLDRVVELVRERFGDGSVIFASSMAPMWS